MEGWGSFYRKDIERPLKTKKKTMTFYQSFNHDLEL